MQKKFFFIFIFLQNDRTKENNTENRNDYESGRFNHELWNELRKNQNETRETLNFEMLQFSGQLKDLLFVKIIVFLQKYF